MTITMTYKRDLELYFHPSAFATQSPKQSNAPISLTYLPADSKPMNTTLRFHLQLLRASLQALPQSTTRIPDLLASVSQAWDTALTVVETQRRLNLETLTTARIVSDEHLAIDAFVLLPKVKTKVMVSFSITCRSSGGEGGGLTLESDVGVEAKVVYGEGYNDAKMTKFVSDRVARGLEGWDEVVRELRQRLEAQGLKGFRK